MDNWVSIGADRRSLRTLHEQAARAAAGFASLGVRRGDAIAIILRNDFPFIEASIGAGLLGAYVVPINWHNTPDEARHVIEDCGTQVIVAHADLLEALDGTLPPDVPVIGVPTPPMLAEAYGLAPSNTLVPPDTLDWHAWLAGFAPLQPPFETAPGSMIYTSGTTGRPKGVRREPPTPEQTQASLATSRLVGGLAGEENMDEIVLLIPGPAYHSSPNGWMFSFLRLGANLVVQPRFDAEALLQDIEMHRVSHLLAVPTMFVRLLALPESMKRRYDLSSLRFVMHVGAPCPPHVKHAMIDWFGPIITEHYGSTEVGAVTLCTAEEWLAHPGTVGRVLPGVDLEIFDAEGRPLPVGQTGQIACRRQVYADFTYHGDETKRQRAARGDLIATGDMGYLDEAGFLYLNGRDSDMIIFGGSNIYPAEIEHELMRIPGVVDCAVFGIPHPEYGEQVCAFIQLDEHAALDARAILAALQPRLASYKLPRHIEMVDSLPREDTGKIFKRKLKEPFWQSGGDALRIRKEPHST